MNERIRELERQAEKFVMGIPASLDINEYTSVFNEKFAELIIQECCSAIRLNDVFFGGKFQGAILKHFGVDQ
jgi:hypothetical protein